MVVELAQRKVSVDLNTCNGCAVCAQVCPTGVFDILEKKSVVSRPEDCIGCQLCESECPVLAIEVQRPVLRLRREEMPVAAPRAAAPAPRLAAQAPLPPPAPPPPPRPVLVGVSVAPPPPPAASPVETRTPAPGETLVRGKPLSHYFRSSLRSPNA